MPFNSICLRQGTKPYHERYVRTQGVYVEYYVYVKDSQKRVVITFSLRRGRDKSLFQHNRFIGSVKLHNEIVKKANLTNNAAKSLW